MTIRATLNLTSFAPALDQLARKVDSPGSSVHEIADAAIALSSGIIALAIMQSSESDPSCPWEGSLDDQTLSLYSATHQMVFSLQNGLVKTAVLSGPQCITWNLNRSERGLHVMGSNADGTIFIDSLIANDGTLKDIRNVSDSLKELHTQWQQIASTPEGTLPPYVPAGSFVDIELPGTDSLADVTSADSAMPHQPDSSSSLSGGNSAGFSSNSGTSSKVNNADWLGEPPSFSQAGNPGSFPSSTAADYVLKGVAAGAAAAAIVAGARVVSQQNHGATGQFVVVAPLVLANVIGEKYEVREFPAVVGRTGDCQIPLPGNLVSRQHARFFMLNGSLTLEDLNSSNGTWVNEERLTAPIKIFRGDNVKFADIELMVIVGPEHQSVAPENLKTVTFNMAEKLQQQKQARPEPQQVSPPPAASTPLPPQVRPASPPNSHSPAQRPTPQPAAGNLCTRCNKPLSEGAKFCPHCGSQQNQPHQCTGCGKELLADAKFCPDCGQPRKAAPSPSGKPAAGSPPPPIPGTSENKGNSAPPPPPPPPPARSARQSSPPIPDEDLLAKAASVARKKSAEQAPGSAPAANLSETDSNWSAQWAEEKPLTADQLIQAPSLGGIAFCFGLLMIADHARILVRFGAEMADSERFAIGLGIGISLTLFAWIAGSSQGFFRFLAKVNALAFVAHQLYRDHMFLMHIAEDPELIVKHPDNLLPIFSLLFALWLFKRARSIIQPGSNH